MELLLSGYMAHFQCVKAGSCGKRRKDASCLEPGFKKKEERKSVHVDGWAGVCVDEQRWMNGWRGLTCKIVANPPWELCRWSGPALAPLSSASHCTTARSLDRLWTFTLFEPEPFAFVLVDPFTFILFMTPPAFFRTIGFWGLTDKLQVSLSLKNFLFVCYIFVPFIIYSTISFVIDIKIDRCIKFSLKERASSSNIGKLIYVYLYFVGHYL